MAPLPILPSLAFDDAPLEPILEGFDTPSGTPADVLDLWRTHDTLTPAHYDALLAVLVRDPDQLTLRDRERAGTLLAHARERAWEANDPRPLLQLARLARALHAFDVAARAYQRLLDSADGLARLGRTECWRAMEDWAVLLTQQGRGEEARCVRSRVAAEQWLAGECRNDLTDMRALARDLALGGDLGTAERVYRELLRRDFETVGTRVHLARVYLLQRRVPEARRVTAQAARLLRRSAIRSGTPSYVVQRVLYLRLLLAQLAGKPYGLALTELQREWAGSRERTEWTIGPVLAQLAGRLPPAGLRLLERLADVINGKARPEALDGIPEGSAT